MAKRDYSETEPKIVRQMTISQFEQLFPDEESCKHYLRDRLASRMAR
jgi:hypothetical protein